MTAQENGGDTLAEGALMRRIFAAPAGVRLLRIVSDTTSSFNYADRDHEEDIIVPSRGEVVYSSRHRRTRASRNDSVSASTPFAVTFAGSTPNCTCTAWPKQRTGCWGKSSADPLAVRMIMR